MGAEIVQANYEELEQLASRFGQQSEMISQLTGQVQRQAQVVARSWLGDASDAFAQEMEADVFPALKRFTEALGSSQQVTAQVSEIMRSAEEEAEAIWRDWAIDGGVGAGGAGA
ncbi:MAG TPA: WXG100 family type VII secretion target, partial [Herpetosiphonaceae bacterium]